MSSIPNMPAQRKLILYIAMSLDGYIAQPNDDLSFLTLVEKPGEDYGYADFMTTVDTIIMGRKTYDWVVQQVGFYPHADKASYIITRTARPAVGNVQFYTGSLPELLTTLRAAPGKHIFCDGGGEVVNALLQHNLLDELIISIIPILLGRGTPLFHDGRPTLPLELVQSRSFDTGLVQLHYKRAGG